MNDISVMIVSANTEIAGSVALPRYLAGVVESVLTTDVRAGKNIGMICPFSEIGKRSITNGTVINCTAEIFKRFIGIGVIADDLVFDI